MTLWLISVCLLLDGRSHEGSHLCFSSLLSLILIKSHRALSAVSSTEPLIPPDEMDTVSDTDTDTASDLLTGKLRKQERPHLDLVLDSQLVQSWDVNQDCSLPDPAPLNSMLLFLIRTIK